MITLHLAQAQLKAWSGYTSNRSGFLPTRMSWMEPAAALSINELQKVAESRFEFTDGFRSPEYQLQCIVEQAARRRLFAPPTKSGHNWGCSVDVSVNNTLANLKMSSNPELVVAGQSRDAMARFMARFGWTGIRSENWHFNHLNGHRSTTAKINAIHGSKFVYDDHTLQRMLNKYMNTELVVDGDVGPKTKHVVRRLQRKLILVKGVKETGEPDEWTRRLLAGLTMKVEKAA